VMEPRLPVPLTRSYAVWGVGAGAMAVRNSVSLGSVRTLSPLLVEKLPAQMGPNSRATLGDLLASTATCLVSAPLSQVFNFLVTTPEAQALPLRERAVLVRDFLRRQYVLESGGRARLSPVAMRDFSMRTLYVGSVFTLFTSSERVLCDLMRS